MSNNPEIYHPYGYYSLRAICARALVTQYNGKINRFVRAFGDQPGREKLGYSPTDRTVRNFIPITSLPQRKKKGDSSLNAILERRVSATYIQIWGNLVEIPGFPRHRYTAQELEAIARGVLTSTMPLVEEAKWLMRPTSKGPILFEEEIIFYEKAKAQYCAGIPVDEIRKNDFWRFLEDATGEDEVPRIAKQVYREMQGFFASFAIPPNRLEHLLLTDAIYATHEEGGWLADWYAMREPSESMYERKAAMYAKLGLNLVHPLQRAEVTECADCAEMQ